MAVRLAQTVEGCFLLRVRQLERGNTSNFFSWHLAWYVPHMCWRLSFWSCSTMADEVENSGSYFQDGVQKIAREPVARKGGQSVSKLS